MCRRFCWGGSTSVSTASSLEITLNSKIIYGRLVRSASPASVPDDTEVIPPQCPEANIVSVTDDTEVIPPKCPEPKPSPKKLSASAPLREITVPAKPPPTQDCPENPGVKPVATKKGSSSFTRKIPLCAYCGGDSVGEGRPPCRLQAV